MSFPVLVVLALVFSTANTAAGNDDGKGGIRKLAIDRYLPDCKIRLDRLNLLKHTCEEVYKHQELCQEPLTVSYSSFPPYIFKNDDGKVVGLLPGLIVLLNLKIF